MNSENLNNIINEEEFTKRLKKEKILISKKFYYEVSNIKSKANKELIVTLNGSNEPLLAIFDKGPIIKKRITKDIDYLFKEFTEGKLRFKEQEKSNETKFQT